MQLNKSLKLTEFLFDLIFIGIKNSVFNMNHYYFSAEY